MMGLMIYLACDDKVKEMLRKAETGGDVTLYGTEDDKEHSKLIEKKATIAKDAPTEKIRREVHLLKDKQRCKRKENETTKAYENRFDVAVAEYVHIANMNSSHKYQQWAILRIQNANLAPDTIN